MRPVGNLYVEETSAVLAVEKDYGEVVKRARWIFWSWERLLVQDGRMEGRKEMGFEREVEGEPW
jgi:hypothetical protein